jgi:hypothetical protein
MIRILISLKSAQNHFLSIASSDGILKMLKSVYRKMAIVPLRSSREKQTCHQEVSLYQRGKVSIHGKKAQL